MNFLNKLKSKKQQFISLFWFLSSILSGLLFSVFIISQFLPVITYHNKTIEVPNLIGLDEQSIAKLLHSQELNYKIIRDNSYLPQFPLNVAIDQNPKCGEHVKRKRCIKLTFNASEKPKIQLPNLIDKSVRYVYALFKLKRLNIGNIKYVDDIAHNIVLELYCNGKKIRENQMVTIDSVIDLTVGVNKTETEVPDICHLLLNDAIIALLDSCLNIGNIKYVETINKELNNIVVSQSLNKNELVQVGSTIDISVYKSKQ